MNTPLIVWSIIAGDRRNSCRSVEELYDWCHSQSHINFQVLSSDEVLSLKPSKGMHPDLILINSRRRGEFSGKTLERVVGKYPLSLVLEITGDWCIGDTRSGHPLPIPCRFDATVGHQRLSSILASRQRFLHMRGALNPLVSFAELSSFWNKKNIPSHCISLNLIASDRSERQALQWMLVHERFKVDLYPNVRSIADDNRYRPIVHCIRDRHELKALFEETLSSPIIIITSHFNELDKTCFEGESSVTFLRKPFISHDLVNAISNVSLLANVNVA